MAITPSEYEEEFVVASIKAFISDLELIDNVILNNLANQNKARYELIKKSAKSKKSKTIHLTHSENMSRRSETRSFKGGFIPTEIKSSVSPKQSIEATTSLQGSSDRDESLSDPRWHKKPPVKGKKNSPQTSKAESTTQVQDAREIIKKAEETRKKSNFPKQSSPTIRKNNNKPIDQNKRK